ncbi:hypothetical protein FA13DRAFT_1725533 [Coprinellus micaceus]|uniref:Bromodomain associated domain-containing protein n=1 Tax=Coprinellus micaceus TaxID=71717 RepID=A0A4Y7TVA1_COPMI|nr:hypothetical protein FA13DRAFT_1725533 [Coprinellus micaceus]
MGGGMPAPTFAQNDDDAVADDRIDERHWLDIAKAQQRGRRVEIGEENANSCTRWVGEKILEHAGFQGASRGALDVLTGVFEEFLGNVGRKEIILHTLFESGVSKVAELERFITDDVERYGTRLLELEKKLVNAYRETTAGDILEEEGLFDEDEEEEAGALTLYVALLHSFYFSYNTRSPFPAATFADSLGEDYLGLRELGIAQEFGLSTLSIPKSLLRRKKANAKLAQAKPTEKPLDYPLPPPPPAFTHATLGQTIGLLRPYYEKRFELRARTLLPTPMSGMQATPMMGGLQPLAGPVLGGTTPSVLMPPPPSVPGYTNLPGPSLTNLPGPKLYPPPVPAPTTTLYPPNPYPTPSPAPTPSMTPMALPQMPATSSKPPPTPTLTSPTLPPTNSISPVGFSPAPTLPPSNTVTLTMPTPVPSTAPSSFPVPLLQPPPPLVIPPDMDLPDDPVPYAQAKMGPLGQITKPNTGSVSSSKKKSSSSGGGGGGGSSSSNPPSTYPGGGGGGATTTFIPTIIGPNGLNAQMDSHGRGSNTASPAGRMVGPDGQPARGPGRPPKKKDPPPGLVLPVSATTSQASSNGGYAMLASA